jgi:GMP synthase (glutamine-hydrolysing)
MKKPFCVIDCAIKDPCYDSFNRLVERLQHPILYHRTPYQGMDSLKKYPEAKGYIIFGSASSVNDGFEWQIQLANFIDSKLKMGIPVMGICFGHQLMANFFGGKVGYCNPNREPKDEKYTFFGNRKFEILKDGFIFKKGEKFKVFKVHSEEVKTISDELIHIGKSNECFHEVLIHKSYPYFGLQGHPEAFGNFIDSEMIKILSPQEIRETISDGERLIDKFINYVLTRT